MSDILSPQFLRLKQIIGDASRGLPPVIPVCRSTWWQGVKEGRYPAPIKLGLRCTAWKASDIRALAERLSNGEGVAHE
ncbi:MAG: helix-turn-helix transcriptional regulator [Thermodesulfobacteriota bacterium]